MAAERVKMAAMFYIFLVNVLEIVYSHNEEITSVQSASTEDEGQSRYLQSMKSRRVAYEGIPIEMEAPLRRSDQAKPQAQAQELKARPPTTTRRTTTTTTTTTRTTPIYPPLDKRFRRIYNPDERATVEDYPFMAALLVNNELWCGAAIIGPDRVLTAAHCLQLQYNNRFFREYVKMLNVRVGSTNATSGGELMRVTEIAFHPNYKPTSLEFNAAILKLYRNLTTQDSTVQIVPFSRINNVPVETEITFLGWGSVLGGGGTGGEVLLQKVTLPIYDLADCQQIYGRELVTRNNFCAGYITKAKNVCNHDAGGPAIQDGVLVGILSFSSKRCDRPDQPAVFISVGPLAPWIDEMSETTTPRFRMA